MKYEIRRVLLQPSGKAHTWGTQVLWAGHKGCKNIFHKQWNCSETGCQLMFLLEWCRVLVLPTQSGCCSKTEKEKKRDIAEVKGAQTMWQAAPCWQILCGMHCFPNFFTSPQRIMFILWITNEKFFFWLSTLGTFFGTSFTQPEQQPGLLMVWALLIYTYQWLKIPVYCSYCTVFQCTGGKQSYCPPYVSNNKHKTGN